MKSLYLINYIGNHRRLIFKVITLLLISLLYLGRAFHDFKTPIVTGDGFEYILMTEAISSHYSVDVTLKDYISFKEKFERAHKWSDFYQKDYIDIGIDKLKLTKSNYKEAIQGLYCTRDKKWYSYHFFFYSLLNVPAYLIGSHYGPVRTFYFTNALLVIIACIALLFYTPFKWYNSITAALSFAFSSAYWYLSWQHTEILTMTLIALTLVNYFNREMKWALFFSALACLQNQPLVILFGFIAFHNFLLNGMNKKNIILTLFFGLIAIAPPIFYYLNFETTNLIKDAGFLDRKYITANRVFGFYFDFNQGMILSIPFILIAYIAIWFITIIHTIIRKLKFDLSLMLPLVLVSISIIVCSMGNWNHGMAIINRYASWLSVFVIVHLFYLTSNLDTLKGTVLFNYFFLTQCFTTLYHEQFNKFGWSSLAHTPLAKWFLTYHPEWYDPDPFIFAGRTVLNMPLIKENSPFVFFHGNEIKKMLINKDKTDDLLLFGMTKENVEKIKHDTKFNFDWGYVDPIYFKSGFDGLKVKKVIRDRKIQAAAGRILGSIDWTAQIKQKAKDWGKTFDEALWIDAEYIVILDEKAEEKR